MRYGSPKLCGVVAQVIKYARGHLAIPIDYIYIDMIAFVVNTMSHLARLNFVGIIDLSNNRLVNSHGYIKISSK